MPESDEMPPGQVPSPSHAAAQSPFPSLAATAAMNAGIQTEDARRSLHGPQGSTDSARRRSSLRMNLSYIDPTLPGPGELQMSPTLRARGGHSSSPYRERAPSLGELHQELESEQEGQVNRLLQMLQQQQSQIASLTSQVSDASQSFIITDDNDTSTSERTRSPAQSANASMHRLPHVTSPRMDSPCSRREDREQNPSRQSSNHDSPGVLPVMASIDGQELSLSPPAVIRDEIAFYQAEIQNLTRENQMLKLRIKELERLLGDADPQSPMAHSPAVASNLASFPVLNNESV